MRAPRPAPLTAALLLKLLLLSQPVFASLQLPEPLPHGRRALAAQARSPKPAKPLEPLEPLTAADVETRAGERGVINIHDHASRVMDVILRNSKAVENATLRAAMVSRLEAVTRKHVEAAARKHAKAQAAKAAKAGGSPHLAAHRAHPTAASDDCLHVLLTSALLRSSKRSASRAAGKQLAASHAPKVCPANYRALFRRRYCLGRDALFQQVEETRPLCASAARAPAPGRRLADWLDDLASNVSTWAGDAVTWTGDAWNWEFFLWLDA
eukprot:scaffold2.g7329.t1